MCISSSTRRPVNSVNPHCYNHCSYSSCLAKHRKHNNNQLSFHSKTVLFTKNIVKHNNRSDGSKIEIRYNILF